MSDKPNSEPSKKQFITRIDISKLSRVRPTRIPSVVTVEETHKQRTSYRRLAIDAGILCLIVLAAYGVSILGDFAYNDRYILSFLVPKQTEESFWSNLVVKAISQPLSQPLITTSFAFDLQNFGYESSWYHVVNIVLHLLCCLYFYLLVYVLARYFWQDDGREQPVHELALCASALFACHPLGAESVAHICGRVASMTACNFFLTLNFFVWAFLTTKMKNVFRGYVLTFIFLLQAIFCGIQSLALPACMLLLAVLLKPQDLSFKQWFQEKWGELIVIVVLLLIMPLIALPGFTADYSNGYVLPLQSQQIYIASQFQSLIIYYLRCLFLPIGLSIFPPNTVANGLGDPLVIVGYLIMGAGAYLVCRLRNRPLIAFGIGLAILSYLTFVFFPQNEIAADWRFYIPLAGICLAFASLLKPWLFSWKSSLKVRAAIFAVIALLITGSIFRSLDFRSAIHLLKMAVRANEKDLWAKGTLGQILVLEHKAVKGLAIARQVVAVEKNCQPAHVAIGMALLPNKKDRPETIENYKAAKEELEKALDLAKSQHLGALAFFDTQRALAGVLVELGEYARAKEIAEQALLMNPNSNSLNIIMGRSLNGLGKYLAALPFLNKAFEHDQTNPDFIEPMAECALGISSPSLINVAYNVSRMGVKVSQTRNMELLMARAALATGHLSEAQQWIELTWRKSPADPKILYVKSFVLEAAGKHALAQIAMKGALAADPNIAKKVPMYFLKKDKSEVITFEELYPLAKKK